MKIRIKYPHGQVCRTLPIIIIILVLAACGAKKEEPPVMPPITSPLTQMYIGYGVINVSYTRINSDPEENSVSPGYLRRGSVVKIAERRLLNNNGQTESWVLVDGSFKGWLRESLVDIYDNEKQAETAIQSMRN